MAEDLAVYTVIHQPRRLKLPAQPIPPGASPEDVERCLFDERLNERYFRKVAQTCYWPATEVFTELVAQGLKLNLGFSLSFLRQAQAWDPRLLDLFRRLVAHPNVELIGVEPYHSFILLLDLERFVARMSWAQDRLEAIFGQRPTVTDTTELCMSDPIALALDRAGFSGSFIDGRPWVLGWREPSFLYHSGRNLKLLARHHRLSDDVGYRFSNRTWSGWPLFADTYAHWLREARGDLVVLGWDYETFGEHHWRETGIFDFLRRLPWEVHRRGMRFLTASEAIAAHAERSHHLPLPAFPSTWAGSGGMEFFLGNGAQQAIFQLMLHAYNKARLTHDRRALDLALWLTQSDNLHLIQWFGHGGSEAEVSAYFTPREWWELGSDGIIWELQQVYKNFIRALDGGTRRAERLEEATLPPLDPEVEALLTKRERRGPLAPAR
ncbi:MAG: glycoside hydrolase [Chloroflexi bacterium]|nr:glycoside hydrolase [Chloroflexota bacterium]